MARKQTIKLLRTTRANLNTQRDASGLIEGEPYLITDESRIAIATAVNAYEVYAKTSEAGGSSGETANVEALSADKTLTATDAPIQMYTCTANRIVNLPTEGVTTGQKFELWNKNVFNSTYYLIIKQSSTAIDKIYAGDVNIFRYDGTYWANWYVLYNTAIGTYANGSSVGAAVGTYANGSSAGAAVGYNANGSSNGAAICTNANGSSNGAAVGYSANGSSNGAAVGYNANGSSNGAAVGYYANTNSKGSETTAISPYSKAERNREFVSTATASTTNLAQLTIQKYSQKDLATASAAWQELFIDASSARLTIIASSVYNFRAQINAIDGTNYNVKTWEIVGTIKRNAANATSIVGTPTVTVIGADTAAANWDARITADDTNESLKVEVKHDSANNVRFSLNIIATETRV